MRWLPIAIFLFILMSLFIYSPVFAEVQPEELLINTYEADITGDGQNETIELIGVLFSQETKYYREVWADISSVHGGQWKIPYEGGYEPSLQFIDLNQDQITDIFYQSSTGGSGGLYNYHLHYLENEKLKELQLPEQRFIKGSFKDNFKVSIHVSPDKDPVELNVKDRAGEYLRLELYDKQGNLLKPTSVMIDPIAFFEPLLISKSKGYGLKSYQQISGAYHADRLGTVETLWYYENEEWIILQTEWVSSS
ncbi:hypothetical protein QGM71_15425 [Virgibacillus sp. C22-A2]|uniref:VCBS repeat-containing protein n=1 Tax=Virgibacillus tibetensis TaxID=3042313 RepID=A0ABU6KID5_9BACI|nr:hypothetical protein [Virgibacillus sp. C22-A2]